MGFLEKLKNTFFEEEIVEVEEPPKKVKVDRPPKDRRVKKEVVEEVNEEEVERPEIPKINPVKKEPPKKEIERREEIVDDLLIDDYEEPQKEVFTEQALTKLDSDFKYFEDDDFIDIEEPPREVKKVEEEKSSQPYAGAKLYTQYGSGVQNGTKQPYSQTKDNKAGFRPTPIISPIYGILDQNYKKEEIVDKKEVKPTSSYVSRKNVDLDSVRNKAFGELTQDLGLTNQEPIVIEEIKDEEIGSTLEDNLLYDMNDVDTTPTVDKVTIADAEEYFQDLGLEYNVDYKDIKYEKANGRRARTSPAIDDIDEEYDMEPVREKTTRRRYEEDDDDDKLEDNLFDLIDSMYEEKE